MDAGAGASSADREGFASTRVAFEIALKMEGRVVRRAEEGPNCHNQGLWSLLTEGEEFASPELAGVRGAETARALMVSFGWLTLFVRAC